MFKRSVVIPNPNNPRGAGFAVVSFTIVTFSAIFITFYFVFGAQK